MKEESAQRIVAAGRTTGAVIQVMGLGVVGLVAYLLFDGKPWLWPAETQTSKWVGLGLVTTGSLLVGGGLLWLGFLFRRRVLYGVSNEDSTVLTGLVAVQIGPAARTAFQIGTSDVLGVPGVGYVAWLGAGWYIVCAEAAQRYAACVGVRPANPGKGED